MNRGKDIDVLIMTIDREKVKAALDYDYGYKELFCILNIDRELSRTVLDCDYR